MANSRLYETSEGLPAEAKRAVLALNRLHRLRLFLALPQPLRSLATNRAIEELQHFQLVLNLLKARGIPFGQPFPSPWISGLMRSIRNGERYQVIDHLICCSLIEGRSCEKFQILAAALRATERELSDFYQSLVESEGNHYATYILMARQINEPEADRRLKFYLELDAELIRQSHPLPLLH